MIPADNVFALTRQSIAVLNEGWSTTVEESEWFETLASSWHPAWMGSDDRVPEQNIDCI